MDTKLSKPTVFIGIDTGVHTGMAIWNPKTNGLEVRTVKIHNAIITVYILNKEEDIKVYIEDARLRKWYGDSGREQLQGAGSIKRDCKIWEDFLTDLGVPFELVPPKNNRTKLDAEQFGRLTGYKGRTSQHGRDAAMLVWGR